MRSLKFLLLLVPLAGLACGGDDATGPIAFGGRYDLVSVNGARLPILYGDGGGELLELAAGSLTIGAQDRYTNTTAFRTVTSSSTALDVMECPGTLTRANSNLAFQDDATARCNRYFTGTASGRTITTDVGGVISVYRKSWPW